MSTHDLYDRPPEIDLAPRWLVAFLLVVGLLSAANAFIYYVAALERTDRLSAQSPTHEVQRP